MGRKFLLVIYLLLNTKHLAASEVDIQKTQNVPEERPAHELALLDQEDKLIQEYLHLKSGLTDTFDEAVEYLINLQDSSRAGGKKTTYLHKEKFTNSLQLYALSLAKEHVEINRLLQQGSTDIFELQAPLKRQLIGAITHIQTIKHPGYALQYSLRFKHKSV